MHLLFCAHFIIFFSFLTVVEHKTFFPSKMLRECLVCVICNSKSIHSFIFKLCIMVVHTLKMCTFYFMHISLIFFHFWGVLNLDIFSLEMLRWYLVCVICNSKSFHSLIFKLCIMIVHTLNISSSLQPLFFCANLINIFLFLGLLNLDIFFHPKCLGDVWFV